MPAWTLSDIVSHATQALGNRSDIALSTASFWANEAQRFVWDSMPHEQQEALATSSTTDGEDKISLPTDFQEMLHVSNTSSNPPASLQYMNIENAESWQTTTGTPTHYMLYQDWLELRPSPDSSYSIQLRYRKKLSEMTLGASLPSVGTRFRYGVFLKAKELLAQHAINSPEQATLARNEYISFMNSVPSDRALRFREQRFMGVSLPRARDKTPGAASNVYDFDTSDT